MKTSIYQCLFFPSPGDVDRLHDYYSRRTHAVRNGNNVLFLDLNEWESSALGCVVGRIVGLFYEEIEEIRAAMKPLLSDAMSWFLARRVDYVHLSLSGESQFLVDDALDEGWRPCGRLNVYRRAFNRPDADGSPADDVVGIDGPSFRPRIAAIVRGSILNNRILMDAGLGDDQKERWKSAFAESLAAKDGQGKVVRGIVEDGEVRGFYILQKDLDLSETMGTRFGYLWYICVAPERQRRGAGSLLMTDFCHAASSMLDVCEISVSQDNAIANSLYKKFSFDLVGTTTQLHRHLLNARRDPS